MLYFVGLGLEQSLSFNSLKELSECDRIYYESYTSPIVNDSVLSELGTHVGENKIERVKRDFVEDGRKILELAEYSSVALVCSGDPMVATTHQELRTRAINQGIKTRVIHSSSVLCAVMGESGLHAYNFGRVVTLTRAPMQDTAYKRIFRNLMDGVHTTLLLEWDESSNFFLEPKSAISSLLEAERDIRYGILKDDSLVILISRLGRLDTKLAAISVQDLLKTEVGPPPHVMVIPGKLHFTEREALGALVQKSPDSFLDNSGGIERISHRMVSKYSEKTLKALERAKKAAESTTEKTRFADIFENVECYTRDAQRFLNEGKEELAVLSIGYAEGLLDSLRFGGQLEFEW